MIFIKQHTLTKVRPNMKQLNVINTQDAVQSIVDLTTRDNSQLRFNLDKTNPQHAKNLRRNYIISMDTIGELRSMRTSLQSIGHDNVVLIVTKETEMKEDPLHVQLKKHILKYYEEKNCIILVTSKTVMSLSPRTFDDHPWSCIYTSNKHETNTVRVDFDKIHGLHSYVDIDDHGKVTPTDAGRDTKIDWSFKDYVLYPLKNEKVECNLICENNVKQYTFYTTPTIDFYTDGAILVDYGTQDSYHYFTLYGDQLNVSTIDSEDMMVHNNIDIHYFSKNMLSGYKKRQQYDLIKGVVTHFQSIIGDDATVLINKGDDVEIYPETWNISNTITDDCTNIFVSFTCGLSSEEKKAFTSKGYSLDQWYKDNYLGRIRRLLTSVTRNLLNKKVNIVVIDEWMAEQLKEHYNRGGLDIAKVIDHSDQFKNIGYRKNSIWVGDTKKHRSKVFAILKQYKNGYFANRSDVEEDINHELSNDTKQNIVEYEWYGKLKAVGEWKNVK